VNHCVHFLPCVALALSACGPAAPPPGPPLIFDTNVRKAYELVRDCRSPGEHSGLNAFTVWVNSTGAASFAAIWQTPPATNALADGSIVVKEIYTTQECDPSSVDFWVAMKKKSGFDPANGDWYWQKARADGTVVTDGRRPDCSGCHTGNDPTCDGYGLKAGRDYLCTAP
jgi:hypothetical protein